MDNPENIEDLIKYKIEKSDNSICTVFKNQYGLTVSDAIAHGDKVVVSVQKYGSNQLYDTIYVAVDSDGIPDFFKENEGNLPSFFTGSSGEAFVSVCPYDPDKDYEIYIPLLKRSEFAYPKKRRPFVGEFIGTMESESLFIKRNLFDRKKPDRLLRVGIDVKKAVFSKAIKLPFPNNNRTFIEDRNLNILGREGNYLFHRLLSKKGEILKERQINLKNFSSCEIVNMDFTATSAIVTTMDDRINLVTIGNDNEVKKTELIRSGSDIYSLWAPLKLDDGSLLFRFTHEKGNGWFVFSKDRLLSFFIHEEGNAFYKDLINGEKIDVPYKESVLSGVVKTDGSYALIFYPNREENMHNSFCIIIRIAARK